MFVRNPCEFLNIASRQQRHLSGLLSGTDKWDDTQGHPTETYLPHVRRLLVRKAKIAKRATRQQKGVVGVLVSVVGEANMSCVYVFMYVFMHIYMRVCRAYFLRGVCADCLQCARVCF